LVVSSALVPFCRRIGLTLILVGCGEVREQLPSDQCIACHGGPAHLDGRPPPDLLGDTDTSEPGVGAHTAHLDSPTLSHPLPCKTCHVVPASVAAPGHLDRTAEEKGTPADVIIQGWDPKELRCGGTYCHARSGAANPAPKWTQVDGTQIGCDGCHGKPPPAPHPSDTRCSLCHPGVNEAGDGFADTSLHLDGKVDLTPDTQCGTCHGREPDGMPPPDLDGNMETMFIGVGAHQAHVDSMLSETVKNASCDSCHRKPLAVLDEGHLDAAPADVRFDLGLGMTNGATPAWHRDDPQPNCTNTYCHGATLTGGTKTAPVWTDQTDDYKRCDGCHGNPPPPPHTDVTNCSLCHDGVGGAGSFVPDPALHVNGTVDHKDFPSLPCDGCHGYFSVNNNYAPPRDLDGNMETTSIGVGAHQAHLKPAGLVTPVACETCHVVPAFVQAPGHFDDPRPAEVNASVGWDHTSRTCTNACHGAASPMWTSVSGSPLPCGTCHGNPPPPPHTTWNDCTACHTTFPAGHVDGTVDAPNLDAMACDSCHGDAFLNGNYAPPPDLAGSSLTMDRGVGAHQTHLSGGSSAPVACGECHAVPVLPSDPGHLDTGPPADIVFPVGGLARTGPTADPVYDPGTLTCSGVYCHQAGLFNGDNDGGTGTTPVWNQVGFPFNWNACGNCHGLPPPSHAGYPSSGTCENCHATATGSPPAIVVPCLHINGRMDGVSATCP
jgi:predicted CxxxxCH...CXXCH cytochrome family protein